MELGYAVQDFRCTKSWPPKVQTFVHTLHGTQAQKDSLTDLSHPALACLASAAATDTLIVQAPVSFQEAAGNPFSLCGQSKC